ncbi:MAG: tetratricopeptide repeat protein [Planctomycetaceae bacterium]|nr:tetratricopeptide repeat protein [Planctomycetaceae bacterium]
MSDGENTASSDKTPDQMYNDAIKLRDSGDLEGTVAALRQILEVAPDHLHTHLALAVYLQKLGQPEQAIASALKAVELDPSDAFSFTQLSVVYQRCGRIMEAEEAMAKAHALQGRTGHRH